MIFNEDDPFISLSKPILITKNSSPKVISDFLKNKITNACNLYYLDESIWESNYLFNTLDTPGIMVNYSKINLF